MKKNKTILVGSLLLFAIISFLAYCHFFYSSEQINSNYFKFDKTAAAHQSDVWTVKFSPDGNWIASGSVDSTAKIQDIKTGKLILNLKHPIGVTSLAFNPDGTILATGSYDTKIRLWQLPQGKLIKELSGHSGTVWSLDFSEDGKTLVSSSDDNTVKIWDIEGGTLVRTLTGHSLTVWDAKFSPDGTKIASGSFDKTLKIWEVKSGKLLTTLTGHSEAIVSLAFSPDSRLLASTSDDKSVKIWSTATWKAIRTLEVPEHVQASDFSPNSKQLVTGGRDKPALGEFLQNFLGNSENNKGVSMRLWDVKTGTLLQTFSQHSNDVNDVDFSPDGNWIASGSSDATVALWKSN